MRSPSQQFAKLSSPRAHRAAARLRLFEQLDSYHDRACVWVCGPPGAGKTTLASSWLEARGRRSFWYQIDAGDDDPATFFTYLVELARSACGAPAQRLPYLTSDYLRDVPGFARRFFRQFFALMPPSVLVIDNHHEVSPAAIDPILRELVAEIPKESQVVVITRLDVPAVLLRFVSTGDLVRVGWETLRLTESETADLVSLHDATHSLRAAEIHALTDGWAAGIVLLSAANVWRPALSGKRSGNVSEAVFAYFTAELFERAPPRDQELLLQTSCFRQFSCDMAQQLTGHPDASTLLDSLYNRHLFTERRFVLEHEYRYHDLFRAYLKERASRDLGEGRWRQVLARGATILSKRREIAQAADLFIEAHEWPGLSELIRNHAPHMLCRGQWLTVRTWLSKLPEDILESDPWLLYWQGMARTAEDPSGARDALEKAYDAFTRTGQLDGRLRACTSIMDVYFQEWNTIASLDTWTHELQTLLTDEASETSDVRLDAVKSLATALLYRHPTHPLLPSLIAEIHACWPRSTAVNQRLLCVSLLFDYFSLMGDFSAVRAIVEQSASDASSDEALPVNAFLWWRWAGVLAYREGRFDEAKERLSTSIAIGLKHGLTDQAFIAQLALAMAEASTGNLDRAATLLVEMRSTLDPTQHMHAVGYHYMDLWLAAANEDLQKATHIWESFSSMPIVGVPVNSTYNFPVIWLLCSTGQVSAALERIERWLSMLADMRSPLLEFNLLGMKAYAQMMGGETLQASETLRTFLRLGARHRYVTTLTWLPRVMGALCSYALDHDLDTEYVRWLICERNIPAPLDAWLWPRSIEIHTLGRFEIVLEGQKLKFAHKAPKKPLALLKALIAAGPRGLSRERAESWLWPELEGDAAAQALTAALLRLRRLLGNKDAIRLSDATLSLDEQSVWVDAFWFEQLTRSTNHCQRALEAYRGAFLPSDDGEPWTLPARDRLRARFVAAAEHAAQEGLARGHAEHAIACLCKAIEVEPLADRLYLVLMRTYVQEQRISEAAGVFQQRRETLCAAGAVPTALPPDLQHSLQSFLQV